ncbi:hypothetical protein C366_02113 [Cryptococcus neoformans Tu401-1]|nr:hypothetical protein C366_02113 [Cryptococcus neoformans var. grubii Tu401-1]
MSLGDVWIFGVKCLQSVCLTFSGKIEVEKWKWMKAAEKEKQQLPILRLTLKDTLLVLRRTYKNSATATYQSFRTPPSSSTAVTVSATFASSAGLAAVVSPMMSTTASTPSSTFIIETASGTSGKKQAFTLSWRFVYSSLSQYDHARFP